MLNLNLLKERILKIRKILIQSIVKGEFSLLCKFKNADCSKLFGDRSNVKEGIAIYLCVVVVVGNAPALIVNNAISLHNKYSTARISVRE